MCPRLLRAGIVVQNHSPSTNSEISENLFILDNKKSIGSWQKAVGNLRSLS
jgi:hypothetical protein